MLKREGFIADYQVAGEGRQRHDARVSEVRPLGESVIKEIRRESKPGRRVYATSTNLSRSSRHRHRRRLDPKGMLSDRECRKQTQSAAKSSAPSGKPVRPNWRYR